MVASPADTYCYTVATDLANLFVKYGIEDRLAIYDDVEHAFPLAFEQKLPEALAFIIGA